MYWKKKKKKKNIKASSRIYETEEKFSLILACSTERKFRAYIKFKLKRRQKGKLVAELLYGISVRKISLPLTDTTHRRSSADVFPTNNTGAGVKRPLFAAFREHSQKAIVKFVSSVPLSFAQQLTTTVNGLHVLITATAIEAA